MLKLIFTILTLPSKIVFTHNFSAIPRISMFLPLNANDEVLAITFKPSVEVSAFIISSVIPSLKYSFSTSLLLFTNGNTAMDFEVICTGIKFITK